MDFKYEPISSASRKEDHLLIGKHEQISDTFPLCKQEDFYPEFYSVNVNNVFLNSHAPNSNTQTVSYCPKDGTLTDSNYTEEAIDCSELLECSLNLNSGDNDKMSFASYGTIRKKRSRTSYTRYQVDELERAFGINPYLTASRRTELSKELNLGENQVKVWFQNRRCRAKKHDPEEKGSAVNNTLPLDILPLPASPTPPTTIQTAEIPAFLSLFPCPPAAHNSNTQTNSSYTKEATDSSQLLECSLNLNSENNNKISSGGYRRIRKKRSRVSYTRHQLGELERAFDINPYLTASRRTKLSKELNLGENQVKVWFQNRRCRAKRHDRGEKGSAVNDTLQLDILPLAELPTFGFSVTTSMSADDNNNKIDF